LLSGARRTIGYQREAYPGTLTHPVAGGRHQERIPETEYVLRLALAAHASPAPELPTLVVAGAASPSLDAMLAAHGIEPADRLVVIHAGSINGSAKRWPSGYWARFADALVRDAGVRIALIGAKADSAIAKEVRTRVSVPIADLTGQTDIPQLAALLCRADLVASGDSGPLHLANALGRPILAVFGPTDVRIYGPYRPSNAALLHRAYLACSPCYTLSAIAECPLGDPICMRLVTPERMVASARALLSGEEV
ncbi:MAG: glycosyltransferase family 9 protein, partial [Chloroflexota bacterium]